MPKIIDSKYKSHIKNYFVIDNKVEVINFLTKSNKLKGKHKSIPIYDFKTSYTSISHDLKDKMKSFVEHIFHRMGKKCIVHNVNGGYFANKNSKKVFSAKLLIESINFVIDSGYLVFNSKVYRQVVGIRVGTNCALFLANIFLHTYEIDFIEKLNAEGKYKVASLLNNTFLYQDNCLVFNDCKQLSRYYNSIYPNEMVLEKTNVSRCASH